MDKHKSRPRNFSLAQVPELLSRLLYVCKVVDFAAPRGVIHRDIKPGNIILGRHGETMLIDLGVGQIFG
jgi:serine/threonine protein kinase